MSFRLGYFLVQRKLLRVEDVDRACRRQLLLGGCLDTQLLALQLLDIEKLQELLPKALELPAPSATWLQSPTLEALSAVPVSWVGQFQVVPVAVTERTIHVLMADHGPPSSSLPLEYWLHRSVVLHPVPELRLFQAMEKLYRLPMPQRMLALSQRYPLATLFDPPREWHQFWQTPANPSTLRPPAPLEPPVSLLVSSVIAEPNESNPSTNVLPNKSASVLLVRDVLVEPQVASVDQRVVRNQEPVGMDDSPMRSSLNLPPVSRLRNAFRASTDPLPDERTLAYDQSGESHPAPTETAFPKLVGPGVGFSRSGDKRDPMRDTIQERNPREFEKTRPVSGLTPEENTSEGKNLLGSANETPTKPEAVHLKPDTVDLPSDVLDPFETRRDVAVLVQKVQKSIDLGATQVMGDTKVTEQDTESSVPPAQAMFELAELFKPELPGAYTIPGLPAFPGTGLPHEADIFPEVTVPDMGWEPLTEEDEQPDSFAQYTDSTSFAATQPIRLPPNKEEMDEYLASQEESHRVALRQKLLCYGSGLIAWMLQYIPAVEHVREKNPVLKERLSRLVELCEEIGDPAFVRLLQILEQAKEGPRMQVLILLGHWRTSRAIAPLLQRLSQETHPVIQRMIAQLLRRYRGQAEFLKLLAFLQENLNAEHPYRLQKSLFYLGHLRITEATEQILPLLQHPDAGVRSFALETLRLLTLQNLDDNPVHWKQWWDQRGNKSRKQWVIDSMNHADLSVRQRVKEELRLEFGDDFGYDPLASVEERETVRRLASLWIQQG